MRPLNFAAASLWVVLAGCAPTIPLEGAKCPCTDGWYCCPGLQVCAATEARCAALPGPVVTPGVAVELGVSRKLKFEATGENVTWEVEDGLIGGSIDADGTYWAPPSPGLYHVIARSSFGARRIAITVRSLRLSVLAGEHGGPSDLPIDGVGEDARLSYPSGGVLMAGGYFFVDTTDPMKLSQLAMPTFVRRLDVATGRVQTLGPPIAQQVFDPTRAPILAIAAHGADRVLLLATTGLELLDPVTLTRTPLDWTGQSLIRESAFVVGDGTAIYGWSPFSAVLVKWVPGAQEQVLSGVLNTPGDVDGAPGQLGQVSALMMQDGLLWLIDQEGKSLRKIDPVTGAITTVRRDPGGGKALLCPAHFANFPGPLEIYADGRPRVGAGSFAGRVAGTGCAWEADQVLLVTGPESIRRFSLAAGVDEFLAGRRGGEAGLDDGAGDRARFAFFGGLVTQARGDTVWFSEVRAKRIRTLTRDGQVTTRFRDVEALSLAVTDEHVYAVIDGVVRRAPVAGGAWEALVSPVADLRLLGTLADGRVVAVSPATSYFIDPTSFSLSAPLVARFGLLPGLVGAGLAVSLDPGGGLLFDAMDGVRRLDLATLEVTNLAPPRARSSSGTLVMGGGRLYTLSEDQPGAGTSIDVFDPLAGGWSRLVGQPFTGAVVPGPLSSALLHFPMSLAVFANGDLLVPDVAENVMLVVE